MRTLPIIKPSIIGAFLTIAYLSFSRLFSDSYSKEFKLLPNKTDYIPFHISHDIINDFLLKTLIKIPSSTIMIDKIGDNLLIASPEGSNIFSKEGLNYLVGNIGKDKFFFSMCSTKVYDSKTSVIHEFEYGMDEIYLFCSKKKLENPVIYYDESYDTTFLTIEGPRGEIAISILGDHPNLLNDVILNEKWADHN